MSEPKTSWGARLVALLIAVSAVATWVFNQTWAQALVMCAMLLTAWQLAFVPSPSARLPLREVYDGYRSGRFPRSTTTSKLVTVSSLLLLVLALVVAH